MSTWRPSACRSVARMPGQSLASSTRSAGAVAEQPQVVRSLKVEQARDTISAARPPARSAPCRCGSSRQPPERVNKAAADGLHVEGRAAVGAELVLPEDAGRGREHHVRRGRGDDDQDKTPRPQCTRCFQAGTAAARARSLRGRRVGEVARMDAGALHDPFSRRSVASRAASWATRSALVRRRGGGQVAAGAGTMRGQQSAHANAFGSWPARPCGLRRPAVPPALAPTAAAPRASTRCRHARASQAGWPGGIVRAHSGHCARRRCASAEPWLLNTSARQVAQQRRRRCSGGGPRRLSAASTG